MATIAGLILAGGQSRRMTPQLQGAPKSSLMLGNKSLLLHAVDRLCPQVQGQLAISMNEPTDQARSLKIPLLADLHQGFAGPLAGIEAGLVWAQRQGAEVLVVVSCDAPFFPMNLVERLVQALQVSDQSVAFAASGGRHHPVFSAWCLDVLPSVSGALDEAKLKVDRLPETQTALHVHWDHQRDDQLDDPFFNINRPEDYELASKIVKEFNL